MRTSFYLLSPKASDKSTVYISLTNQKNRIRFASPYKFTTKYCNVRKSKGSKNLLKRNSPVYFEYDAILSRIKTTLEKIYLDEVELDDDVHLEQIRDTYYKMVGIIKDNSPKTFEDVFNEFVKKNQFNWTKNTLKSITATYNHLKEFETTYGELRIKKLDSNLWDAFRDDYCVSIKKFGNSTTNKYLKKLKQLYRHAIKNKYISSDIDLTDLKYLDEIEPFKIALKQNEVDTLMKLKLTDETRLEKVRDLFLLEILTGQRYGDLENVLNKANLSDTGISFEQQKTGEKVFIPLTEHLNKHLKYIFAKYPVGLQIITNQKFNQFLKEICIEAGIDRKHSWTTKIGIEKITKSDYRYNLVSTHTGRRTFCTLNLKSGKRPEYLMKITGHKSYEQFREYVKVDDEDLSEHFHN